MKESALAMGDNQRRDMEVTMQVYTVRNDLTTFRIALNGPDILDGSRNNTLTSIAGTLHDGTRSQDELIEDLFRVNKARCKPPLSRHEVEGIVRKNYSTWTPCKPSKGRPPQEVLVFVERHRVGVLYGRSWQGRGGGSDESVYGALLEVAQEHGWLSKSGNICVRVAVRELAERAGVSERTCRKALRRLQEKHLLYRRPMRTEGKAGVLVLREIASESPLTFRIQPKDHVWGLNAEVLGRIEKFLRRFRHGKDRLTKVKVLHLEAVILLGGEATVQEVARQLDRRTDKAREQLRSLSERHLVEEVPNLLDEERYRVTAKFMEALEAALVEDGIPEVERAQRLRHKRDREMYAYHRKLKEAARRGENLEDVKPSAQVVDLPFIGSSEEVFEPSAVEAITPGAPPLPECGHGYVGGKGCFLHDPDHPYRRELREAEERVLGQAA